MGRWLKITGIVLGVIVLLFVAVASITRWRDTSDRSSGPSPNDSAAVAAGKGLSNYKCSGEGDKVLTNLPMDESDYAYIIPYGLVIDDHITPIDHQYFQPTDIQSARDTYPVYAMADSKITEIGQRTAQRGIEYRLVFTMSCTFLYYYDLVTSLAPEIQAIFEKEKNRDEIAHVDIDVKAGQLIGRIGGQTLDFAVWNTNKPIKGFVVPEHYREEAWKIYTADPLDYYTSQIKEKAIAKYLRTTEPLSGKIDYDIDGKLIGTWFVEGTGGYTQATQGGFGYWQGHLSIIPDHIYPKTAIFSIGTWGGTEEGGQFTVAAEAADPATVGVETGLVKYDLYERGYVKPDGKLWDSKTLVKGLKTISGGRLDGCALLQLKEARRLLAETFRGKSCAAVPGFTGQEKTYER